MLYLITKLQNLKAIHNKRARLSQFLTLYLITKLQNLKAIHNSSRGTPLTHVLYLITKLQNLKAIHNGACVAMIRPTVVSNYKITKSESYSQHYECYYDDADGCI